MAFLYNLPSSMLSATLQFPAKLPIFTSPIVRTPSPTLHPHLFSFSIHCSKPNSSGASAHKYVYPDPIPEFAQSETRRFRSELLKKLSQEKETFGGDLVRVVDVCAEIFSEFLHKEYGGPGTLMVEPFTDMLVALKEKKLPGAPLAARESLLWAQNYLDQDWLLWNSPPT